MKIMKICDECKIEFENYTVFDRGHLKGMGASDLDICQDCMQKGWSEITYEDIKNDPELFSGVSLQSPYI